MVVLGVNWGLLLLYSFENKAPQRPKTHLESFRTFLLVRITMPAIIKVADREKLPSRREPYWHRIAAGSYLGFRNLTPSRPGSWVARWRDPDTEKQHYQSLGTFELLPDSERFDAASKAAREWFSHVGQGGSTETCTVAEACARYVQHLKRTKGDKSAGDAQNRFERHVFDNARFASIRLTALKAIHVDAWRKRLQDKPAPAGGQRTDSSINRDMTALRAALNLAHTDGLIANTIPWRGKLIPIKNADGKRDVYLDRAQRCALIEAAPPDLAQFIRAMCLLPLRPGALAGLTAAHFDQRLNTLTIGQDKAGRDRKIALPEATAAVFAEAARDKQPTAPLFNRADGKAWEKDAWKHPFKDAATTAKLPPEATMYALRHSTITDLVHGGLDLLTVAQISGTSVRMIEAHYGHLTCTVATLALEKLAL